MRLDCCIEKSIRPYMACEKARLTIRRSRTRVCAPGPVAGVARRGESCLLTSCAVLQ